MKSSRKRSKNFSDFEVKLLLELLTEERLQTIESKQSDTKMIQKKNDLWEKILSEFVAQGGQADRDIKSIKNCWKRLKETAKKQRSMDMKEIRTTGGGSKVRHMTEESSRVCAMLPEAHLEPQLESQYDCDDSDEVNDSLVSAGGYVNYTNTTNAQATSFPPLLLMDGGVAPRNNQAEINLTGAALDVFPVSAACSDGLQLCASVGPTRLDAFQFSTAAAHSLTPVRSATQSVLPSSTPVRSTTSVMRNVGEQQQQVVQAEPVQQEIENRAADAEAEPEQQPVLQRAAENQRGVVPDRQQKRQHQKRTMSAFHEQLLGMAQREHEAKMNLLQLKQHLVTMKIQQLQQPNPE